MFVKRLTIFLSTFFVVAAIALALQAQEPPKRPTHEISTVTIGDHQYTRGQVIADFIDAAFSEHLWNEQRGRAYLESRLNYPAGTNRIIMFEKMAPWLLEYTIPSLKGWPKSDVINKWSDAITIGVALPYRQFGTDPHFVRTFDPIVEKHLSHLVPALSEAIKRPITFMKRDDPRENTPNHARIRIDITEDWKDRRLGGQEFSWHPYSHEQYLWSGVSFESSDDDFMDGYLLIEPSNDIGLVICKIAHTTPPEFVKPLVTECVLRALGLPGVVSTTRSALLTAWHQDIPAGPAETAKEEAVKRGASPYDLFLASLLYCADIKQGMTRNEVVEILAAKDLCFNTQQ